MDKCESCGQNPANVFFKAVINSKSTKMNLCEECAREKGILTQEWNLADLEKPGFSLSDMIGSLSSQSQESLAKSFKTAARPTSGRCPRCQTSFSDFKTSGFAGCSNCYEAFYPAMRQIIKRIHGSNVHTGAKNQGSAQIGAPAASPVHTRLDIDRELVKLKDALRDAVHKEAYEQAAILRDKIQDMESARKSD